MYLNLAIVSQVMVPSRGEGSSLKLGPAGLCVAYGVHRVSNACGSKIYHGTSTQYTDAECERDWQVLLCTRYIGTVPVPGTVRYFVKVFFSVLNITVLKKLKLFFTQRSLKSKT